MQGAASHVDWLLQRQFKSPEELLGAEGDKFRKPYNMRSPSKQFKTKWAVFLAEQRGRTLADIEKELSLAA